jgi:DNA ligase (NAD+)
MERKKELEYLIKKYDKAYEEGHPLITDTEYDILYNELIELEKKYGVSEESPTKYIEDAKIRHLNKVVHDSPMLSQEKCHTKEDIINFVNRINDTKYIVDLKLDGISISLKYKEGKLIQAVTRGNGHYGYDITAAALKMSNVPEKINEKIDIEVRGEVIINDADFERLNKNGEYSNSRNFVAGTLNALDVNLVKDRHLFVNVYDIRSYNGKLGQQMSTIEAHNLLTNLGFNVVKYWIFAKNEIDKMTDFCEQFNKTIRPTLNFKIDGLVIKTNNDKIIEKLGNTSKFPKSSIAFKFDSLDRSTRLKSVEWQVGRTGLITPVANFDLIEIDGVEINKASLANIDNIKKLDIKIEDSIVVARSNDVIPKIISVIKEKRTGKEQEITFPTICPVCGEKTMLKGPLLYCLNDNCSAKTINKISHFATRDAMNIEDLSDKTIEAIQDANIPFNSFEDIYLLHNYTKELIDIERFGEKKVSNLLNEIEKSKNNYLHQLLYGLSIPNIGLSKAKAIASLYKNVGELNQDVINGNFLDKIKNLPDFGNIIVQSVEKWLNSNKNLLLFFESLGTFNSEEISVSNSNLIGKTIVITGELSKPRKEIEKELIALGIKVSSSVSKNTDYVLVGNNNTDTTSSKYQKALKLNIPIIEENGFRQLIKD